MKQTLLDGLRSRGRALDGQTVDTLCAFGAALLEKNRVMNLTAITDPAAVAQLHFLDSLALLDAAELAGKTVLDIGCGAGFPGVPLKIAEPTIRLTLLDSLAKRMNWLAEVLPGLGVEAEIVTGDLFAPVEGSVFDLIACNPPYIRTGELDTLQAEVQREPRLALDGGADGLDFYRIIARRASDFLKSGGRLYLEVGYGQAELVAGLLRENFFVNIKKDYDDIERMILAQKK